MFNDLTSPLSLLATRRSGKPREMVAPGPNSGELAQMLEIAARTPDHGKLAPWRFVIVDRESRPALADMLVAAYRAEKPEAGRLEIEAMENFAGFAPTLVVVLSSPRASSKNAPNATTPASCSSAAKCAPSATASRSSPMPSALSASRCARASD